MRPLDPLSSIKVKLGAIILGSVGIALLVLALGIKVGMSLFVVGAISAIAAVLMVQFLARGMTSPLREMVAAAKAMSRGDYSRRVTATSNDEVGELAKTFNAMAAELAEVDRMRRDLVANVSHELRTPISALQAVLENLIDEVESPDPEVLRTMLMQVQRLGRLVGQLLDLSRLESGAAHLEKTNFRVGEVLEMAVNESRLKKRTVDLAVDVQPADLRADGDPERVHQVVANLVENALRHSPEGGKVTVSAKREKDRVRIEVVDQGPGIPEEEASRVFERFYRSDAARSSTEGGTGLGLAIARWIVDLHGGEIRVESAKPQGCRMVVMLPAAL